MGYRKARIPIRIHRENMADFRDGYTFEACFSNGDLFKMGVYRNAKGQWIVSDLNTGMMVCPGKTRVDAVKKFQDSYLSKLERLVFSNDHWSTSPSCHENFYEHATKEFQALLKAGKQDD